MCGKKLPVRSGVGESNLVFAQVRAVDEVVPETLDHARGDALAPQHAEHPNAADATQSGLCGGGAAPGSLALEHHLLPLRALRTGLLDHPVTLLNVLSDKASGHLLVIGDEEEGFGLGRALGFHLLEAQVIVHHLPDLLHLLQRILGVIWKDQDDLAVRVFSQNPLLLPSHISDSTDELVVKE